MLKIKINKMHQNNTLSLFYYKILPQIVKFFLAFRLGDNIIGFVGLLRGNNMQFY